MVPLLDLLFGCTHRKLSFPITRKSRRPRSDSDTMKRTYVVCLGCGKEFAYDWAHMRIVFSAKLAAKATGPTPVSPQAA